jgi:hypothetical protein
MNHHKLTAYKKQRIKAYDSFITFKKLYTDENN